MRKNQTLIQSSYHENDVTFLLQDVSTIIGELTIAEKEARIQAGESYSGFLSREEAPTIVQVQLFQAFMSEKATRFAQEVCQLAEKIYANKGEHFVLVSLARAGTPIGILLRRYFAAKYQKDIPHYSLSILRGKGIDEAALSDLVGTYGDQALIFVDGWTGKGSIIDELEAAIRTFNERTQSVVCAQLAVVADPAKRCQLYGTREDVAIPNCFFNATISGLISRTVNNEIIQRHGSYHGARYLNYLEAADESKQFIETMVPVMLEVAKTSSKDSAAEAVESTYAQAITENLQERYGVINRHKIKLSVGEAARVLLRRHPRMIIVQNQNDQEVGLLVALAKAKNVPVIEVSQEVLKNYRAAAIIHE